MYGGLHLPVLFSSDYDRVCVCPHVYVWWLVCPSTVVETLIDFHCVPVPGSQVVSCLLTSTAYWFIMSHFLHSQDHLPYCLGPPLCLMDTVFSGQPFTAVPVLVARLLTTLRLCLLWSHPAHGKWCPVSGADMPQRGELRCSLCSTTVLH